MERVGGVGGGGGGDIGATIRRRKGVVGVEANAGVLDMAYVCVCVCVCSKSDVVVYVSLL